MINYKKFFKNSWTRIAYTHPVESFGDQIRRDKLFLADIVYRWNRIAGKYRVFSLRVRKRIALKVYPEVVDDMYIPRAAYDVDLNLLETLIEVTRMGRSDRRYIGLRRHEYTWDWKLGNEHKALGYLITDAMREDSKIPIEQVHTMRREQAVTAMIRTVVDALTRKATNG